MGGKGSGPKKEPTTLLREALAALDGDIPGLFERLKEWAEGKSVVCPHCGRDTGMRTADTVAFEAAKELIDRRLGKTKHMTDVTVHGSVDMALNLFKVAVQEIELSDRKQLMEGKDASEI